MHINVYSHFIYHAYNLLINFRKNDWDEAFDFDKNLDFLSNCIKKTDGKKENWLFFQNFDYVKHLNIESLIFLLCR